MAPAQKANYKTYDAQARMVRAIVAAHPDVRWNYKGKGRRSFFSGLRGLRSIRFLRADVGRPSASGSDGCP